MIENLHVLCMYMCARLNQCVSLCVRLCIWPINWFNCWFQWSVRFPGWGHGEQKRTEGGLRATELVQGMGSRSGLGRGQEMYTARLVLDWNWKKRTEPFQRGHWDSGLVQNLRLLCDTVQAMNWEGQRGKGQIFFFHGAVWGSVHGRAHRVCLDRIRLKSVPQKSRVQCIPSWV